MTVKFGDYRLDGEEKQSKRNGTNTDRKERAMMEKIKEG